MTSERAVIALMLGIVLGILCLLIEKVWSADLAAAKITHRRPEKCVGPTVEPYPGQTMRADKTCKSGLRWVYGE